MPFLFSSALNAVAYSGLLPGSLPWGLGLCVGSVALGAVISVGADRDVQKIHAPHRVMFGNAMGLLTAVSAFGFGWATSDHHHALYGPLAGSLLVALRIGAGTFAGMVAGVLMREIDTSALRRLIADNPWTFGVVCAAVSMAANIVICTMC